MENEEKQLLLKDLCARLPYGVMCKGILEELDIEDDVYVRREIKNILTDIHYSKNCSYATIGLMKECELDNIKPYLRPLSSKTEEERAQFLDTCIYSRSELCYEWTCDSYDWLNAHHFDYRGLIEKGLAIDSTDLGIYGNLEE